MILKITCKTV